MQSPPLEFAVMLGAPLLINLMRNAGEADFDTISENVRKGVDWLNERGYPGDAILAAVLGVGVCGFWRHICRPRWAR